MPPFVPPSARKNANGSTRTTDKTAHGSPKTTDKNANGRPPFSPPHTPPLNPPGSKAAASQPAENAPQRRQAAAAGIIEQAEQERPAEPVRAALAAAGLSQHEAAQIIAAHGIDTTAAALTEAAARTGQAGSFGRTVQAIREQIGGRAAPCTSREKATRLTARGISSRKAAELAERYAASHILAALKAKDADKRQVSPALLVRAIEDNDGQYCPVAEGIAQHRREQRTANASHAATQRTDAAKDKAAELAAQLEAARIHGAAVDALTAPQVEELAAIVRATLSPFAATASRSMNAATVCKSPLGRDIAAQHLEAVRTGARRVIPAEASI